MEDEIEIDEIINGTWCQAYVRIEYEIENAESSSECGNQYVTDSWQELHVVESDILDHQFYDDNGEGIEKEMTPEERAALIEKANEKFVNQY